MATEPEDTTIAVRYSAKELFAQINLKIDTLTQRVEAKLDVVAEKLDAKADHEAFVKLEERVAAIETREAERKGFGAAQKAIVALLLTIAALLVPIVLHFI